MYRNRKIRSSRSGSGQTVKRSVRENVAGEAVEERQARLDELIDRLIARHKARPAEQRPVEQRGALRQPTVERPFTAVSESGEINDIWMEDVSRTGMRFRSEAAYACGTVLTVSAPESFSLEPVSARILRAQMIDPMLPERGFEYGAEFVYREDKPHAWFLATRTKRW